jgi:hypothetical protein
MAEQESLEQKEEIYTPFSNCRQEKACFEAFRVKLLEKSLEISEGLRLTNKEWIMFYRLENVLRFFPNPQPCHIEDLEAEAILGIQKTHKFSIGVLAFIFQRSKSAIFELLKKNNIAQNEESESQRVPT